MAVRTVLKKNVGNEIPAPGLAATLSPIRWGEGWGEGVHMAAGFNLRFGGGTLYTARKLEIP